MPFSPRQSDTLTAAGSRTLPVRIDQMVETISDSGFPVETWSELHRLTWMERIDLSAMERMAARQIDAVYDTRWRMPYQRDMDPDLVDVAKFRRLVYADRVHVVTTARVIGMKRQIELETKTGGAPDDTV